MLAQFFHDDDDYDDDDDGDDGVMWCDDNDVEGNGTIKEWQSFYYYEFGTIPANDKVENEIFHLAVVYFGGDVIS